MKLQPTETLYRKEGRRYVPAYSTCDWRSYDDDRMAVGTFRLTHAYCDGGYRYHHDVTPDTAGWCAAAMLAQHAMTEAMREAAHMRPSGVTMWTKKQLAALEKAKAIMREAGMLLPTHWNNAMPDEVAMAGIEAVRAHGKALQK